MGDDWLWFLWFCFSFLFVLGFSCSFLSCIVVLKSIVEVSKFHVLLLLSKTCSNDQGQRPMGEAANKTGTWYE